ncbi:hypothetical protein [Streptomyces sp. NPDC127084]|uniref:hypothetical protein n=1 Tax=Streptomyces sp. NPDC127084 TaxID=3347133 RepID=UPI00364D0177
MADATGVIGSVLTAESAGQEARLALAGRNREPLGTVARPYPVDSTALFQAYDAGSCVRVSHDCSAALGGFARIVAACAAVAFGRAQEVGDGIAKPFMAVNVLVLAALGGGIRVQGIRPGHPETDLTDRPVVGTAPLSPSGGEPRAGVRAVANALAEGAELLHKAPDEAPVIERRTR